MYLNFNLVLNDVSAFLVDGDYHWNDTSKEVNLLPVIDKCGIALKLQQVRTSPSPPPPLPPKERINNSGYNSSFCYADPGRRFTISFHKTGSTGAFLGVSFLSGTLSSIDGDFKDFSRHQ